MKGFVFRKGVLNLLKNYIHQCLSARPFQISVSQGH